MRKLSRFILLVIALLCILTSCTEEPTVEVNADGFVVVNGIITTIVADKDDVVSVDADGYVIVNGVKTEYQITPIVDSSVRYPFLRSDTKIESLPLTQQQQIDDYVADCQAIYEILYTGRYSTQTAEIDLYVSFTDTFVYDFRKVNESNLGKTAVLWEEIKALNGGAAAPVMYVELSGFCNYFGNAYKPTALSESSITYGYFIFEDETVQPYLYRKICDKYYLYELPDGTELINCGDKYAAEKRMEELTAFYEEAQAIFEAGKDPSDLLKRLSLVAG